MKIPRGFAEHFRENLLYETFKRDVLERFFAVLPLSSAQKQQEFEFFAGNDRDMTVYLQNSSHEGSLLSHLFPFDLQLYNEII